MYNYNYPEDYLMHYGVKGMKWGHRKARGHGGPGKYVTRKRQLAGDKRDLETLNKGGHLSVGMTKKRQAALDKRDKAALEKRITKNEKILSKPDDNQTEKASDAVKLGAELAGSLLVGHAVNKLVKDAGYGYGYQLAGSALGGYLGMTAVDKLFYNDDRRNE